MKSAELRFTAEVTAAHPAHWNREIGTCSRGVPGTHVEHVG